ncbi:MAG: alpha/beta fold hydrolase [Acidimicrobiales bacterium]
MKKTHATDLHTEIWGDGTPVVLVHGSLATGAEEWAEQRPLAERGYRLIVADRRGYGSSPAPAEDYLVDAEDVAGLMGSGAHLVGHSYGGLGAMLAAARRPEATLSLTLLEPAAAHCAPHDQAWQGLIEEVRSLWQTDLSDRDWVVRFLKAVGSDPDELPPEFLDLAEATVPVLRNGRFFADAALPLEELHDAPFPKLVVSGGHHPGFEAMSVDLARRIGAQHLVVAGAGHEIQFTGQALNDVLATCWIGRK